MLNVNIRCNMQILPLMISHRKWNCIGMQRKLFIRGAWMVFIHSSHLMLNQSWHRLIPCCTTSVTHIIQTKLSLKPQSKTVDKSLFSCHLHSQSQRALVFATYSSWVLLAVWTDSLPRESYPYRPITSSRIFWNFLVTFWDSFWNSSLSFWEERSLWDRFPWLISANCILTLRTHHYLLHYLHVRLGQHSPHDLAVCDL